MGQTAYASVWTAALAVVGWHLGSTVHGAGVQSLVCAAAGGAGGFGIACASRDVIRRVRRRAVRPAAGPG